MQTSYYPETNDGRADWWQNKIDNESVISALDHNLAEDIIRDARIALYLYRTLPQLYASFETEVNNYIRSYLSHAGGSNAPVAPPVPAWPALPVENVPAGIEKRREKWVQVLKHKNNYDPALQGLTLMLEAPASSAIDPNTYQAQLPSADSHAPGQVSVTFRKARGAIDAMQFSGRKRGESTFINLGRFFATPASLAIPLSTPGQPEEWEIRGQAVKRDVVIGVVSDIKSVLVRG